ncbi:MAG: hypothetical protein JW722_06685 [Demequinaceae bacterium]|nr:hypothetical protein [Demequinaceae bacterium]
MRTLGYWIVRAALFLCVLLALWAVGWRNWSASIGALCVSWLVAYAVFGTQHDLLSQWLERYFDGRADRRGPSGEAKG